MVHGPPEIVHLAVDLHIDLIEVPLPMRVSPHRDNTLLSDLGRKHRPEPVPPQPHRFMADVDATLRQQVLDVAQGQWVADIHHYHEADHLG